ncbi:MAG: glycerate kinase [Alphaproteobacteria bacterium]|nr:glycerate kinase [Alphaproteobacteria bacterium]
MKKNTPLPNLPDANIILRRLFDQAISTADPMHTLPKFLPARPSGRVIVIGAGKASARMAEAVEREWGTCEGIIITQYGYGRALKDIEVIEASHPIPDHAGMQATHKILAVLENLGEDDFVLCLLSGGASALLCAPAGDITLSEKQIINQHLLASGAPIDKINTVRKHLSAVKGGQLAAAAHPAKILSLILSDVPGDDIRFIGSGPTASDKTTPQQALQILTDYAISIPASANKVLCSPSRVISPHDPIMENVENVVFAAASQSLQAAENLASFHYGLKVINLGDNIQGEARDIANIQAKQAIEIQTCLTLSDKPVLLLSGGELTVTKKGNGIGGANAEFCLALAIALNQQKGIYGLAGDTDGIDGAAEIAGAYISPDTLSNAVANGTSAEKSLISNNSHGFFKSIDSNIITGPTLTNVNDFRAILIFPI